MHDIPIQDYYQLAMFADDMLLMTQSENLSDAIINLQKSVDNLQKWLSNWSIKLNTDKCETKIFTLRQIKDPQKIKINRQEIPWNPKDRAIKYLGVHLDQRLTWKFHINQKLNQGYTRLRQLYPVINKKTPLRLKCILILYKALVRPLVTYGCPVWGNSSATNINKLQVLQNKIIRTAVDAPWFVRNEQIHRELNLPTFSEFITRLTNIHKCSSAVEHQVGKRNIHTRLKRRLPKDLTT